MRSTLLELQQKLIESAHLHNTSHIVEPSGAWAVDEAQTVWQHHSLHLDAVALFVPGVDGSLGIVVLFSARSTDVIAVRSRERTVDAIDGAINEAEDAERKELKARVYFCGEIGGVMNRRLLDVVLDCIEVSGKIIDISHQTLVAQDILVPGIDVAEYPWPTEAPARCMPAEDQITHLLVGEPGLALRHHEQKYFLRMKPMKRSMSVRHADEAAVLGG